MNVPSPLLITEPLAGEVIAVAEEGFRLPSMSESLAAELITTGVSSEVLSESSTAMGGSFTGVTSMVTVAVSQAPSVSQI